MLDLSALLASVALTLTPPMLQASLGVVSSSIGWEANASGDNIGISGMEKYPTSSDFSGGDDGAGVSSQVPVESPVGEYVAGVTAEIVGGVAVVSGGKEFANLLDSDDPAVQEFVAGVLAKVSIDGSVTLPEAPAGGASIVIDPARLISVSDVQRLVTNAGQVSISPNRAWVYVNKPVFFSTDAVAHDRQLFVLGLPVTVHLRPVVYSWDPGDGSPSFTTTGPGGSWPDGSASHSYLKARGNITVGLSVEWSATFTVQGTTYPVVGTTTASTVSPVFETREAEAVLTG